MFFEVKFLGFILVVELVLLFYFCNVYFLDFVLIFLDVLQMEIDVLEFGRVYCIG